MNSDVPVKTRYNPTTVAIETPETPRYGIKYAMMLVLCGPSSGIETDGPYVLQEVKMNGKGGDEGWNTRMNERGWIGRARIKPKLQAGGFIIALQSTHSSLYITRTRCNSSLQAIAQLGYLV